MATLAAVVTGIPMAPYAPDAALATNASIEALSGLKPRDTSRAAQIAIGIPKPAAPSMNPPKQKAISSTWMRWSSVIDETEARTVSKLPARTAMR